MNVSATIGGSFVNLQNILDFPEDYGNEILSALPLTLISQVVMGIQMCLATIRCSKTQLQSYKPSWGGDKMVISCTILLYFDTASSLSAREIV